MSDTADWQLHIVEYARAVDQPMAGMVFGTFDEAQVESPFAFVLARRPGRVALIDCGFEREGRMIEMAQRFKIPHWISPVTMLADLGVKPEDVTDIVLSHAHFDHMGSIHKFPNAHLYMQKKEMLSWVEAMALEARFSFLTDVLNPDDMIHAMQASIEHRLTLVDGDRDDLLPGLHVRLAPGHTLGQQFVLLDTARGRFAVAGDCIYSIRNLNGEGCGHNHGRYVPLGMGIGSVWEMILSFGRIDDHVGHDRDRIIILHDLRRWAQFDEVATRDGFGIWRVV